MSGFLAEHHDVRCVDIGLVVGVGDRSAFDSEPDGGDVGFGGHVGFGQEAEPVGFGVGVAADGEDGTDRCGEPAGAVDADEQVGESGLVEVCEAEGSAAEFLGEYGEAADGGLDFAFLVGVDGSEVGVEGVEDDESDVEVVAGELPEGEEGTDNVPVGMAPGARIVNVKTGDGVGAVDVSQVIAAIDWVVQHRDDNGMNIKVLLLAFDTDSAQDYEIDPLAFAVENAWHHGITVVVSAGNDGKSAQTLGNSAIDPYVISVAAVEPGKGNSWKVPTWASSGDGTRNPDLAMPGQQIMAAAVPGSFLANAYPDAVFDTQYGPVIRGNGTSQAAALAAGAAAVLLEARPELTPDQVKHALTTTATDVGIPDKFGGHGLLDLHPALDADVSGATQTHTLATGTGTLEASRGSYHVGPDGDQLSGETTAFSDTWDSAAWTTATSNASAYTNETWTGATWSSGSWLGATWTGATWTGATWSGATWSGALSFSGWRTSGVGRRWPYPWAGCRSLLSVGDAQGSCVLPGMVGPGS